MWVMKPLIDTASQFTLILSAGIERSVRNCSTWWAEGLVSIMMINYFQNPCHEKPPKQLWKNVGWVLDTLASNRTWSIFNVFADGTWGHQCLKQCSTTFELKATVSKVMTPVFLGEGQERSDPFWRALPRMIGSPSQSFASPCKEVPSIGASSSQLAASSSLAASSEAMGKVTETRVTGQAMLFSQKFAVTKKFQDFQVLNLSQWKHTMGFKWRGVGHWLVLVQLKLSHRQWPPAPALGEKLEEDRFDMV